MGPDRLRWALAQGNPEESQGGVRHRGLGQGPWGTVQTTPALSPERRGVSGSAVLAVPAEGRQQQPADHQLQAAPPTSQSHGTALNFRILQNVQTGQCAEPPGPASESQDRLPTPPQGRTPAWAQGTEALAEQPGLHPGDIPALRDQAWSLTTHCPTGQP